MMFLYSMINNFEPTYTLNYHAFTHLTHTKTIVSSNANVKKLQKLVLFSNGKIQ